MLTNEEKQTSKVETEDRGDLSKYMGEALVASLLKQKANPPSPPAITALAPKLKPAISALAPAMRPAPKPTVEKPRHISFAEATDAKEEYEAISILEQEAEVAASKLLKLIRRADKGRRKSP